MQHFTRLRFAAGTVTLAALAAGCGGSAAVLPVGNPTLQQQVQASASAALQVAQQNLLSHLATLKKDARTLTTEPTIRSDVSTLTTDFGTQQQDWQSERSDNCSSLSDDANLVTFDARTVTRDIETVQTDLTALQTGDVTTVTNDLSNVQNDLQTLKLLGLSPQVASGTEITAGNQALQTADNTMKSASAKVRSVGANSRQLVVTAQKWAKQHGC